MSQNEIRKSIVRYRENLNRGEYRQCHTPYDNHHVWIMADVEAVRDALLNSGKFELQEYDGDYLGKYQMIHNGIHVLVGKGMMEPDMTSVTLHIHLFCSKEHIEQHKEIYKNKKTPLFLGIPFPEQTKRLVDTLEDMINVCETNRFTMMTSRKENDGSGNSKVGLYDIYTPNLSI